MKIKYAICLFFFAIIIFSCENMFDSKFVTISQPDDKFITNQKVIDIIVDFEYDDSENSDDENEDDNESEYDSDYYSDPYSEDDYDYESGSDSNSSQNNSISVSVNGSVFDDVSFSDSSYTHYLSVVLSTGENSITATGYHNYVSFDSDSITVIYDNQLPYLAVGEPIDFTAITDKSIVFTGNVSDDNGVDCIILSSDYLDKDYDIQFDDKGLWSKKIENRNYGKDRISVLFTITVYDLAGNSKSQNISLSLQ